MSDAPKKRTSAVLMYTLRPIMVFILAIGSISIFGFSVANGSEDRVENRLNLVDSIQRSLNVHPKLKSWQLELEKAENETRVARSNFGPSLSMSYNHNELISKKSAGMEDVDYLDQNIDALDLALVQPLFNGFANYNEYQRSKMRRQMTYWRLLDAKIQVVANVQTDFLVLLHYREEVKSLQETVKRLEQNLEAAKAFYDTEMSTYAQVLQADVDLADARQQLSRARMAEKTQTVKLNVLLGLSPDAEVFYEGTLEAGLSVFFTEMEDCLQYALSNRPDLLAAQISIRIAEKDLNKGRAGYYPRIQLEGHYIDRDSDYDKLGVYSNGTTYDRDKENRYWRVGVSMSWDLFKSGKRHYSQKVLKNEMEIQRESLQLLKDSIHTEVRTNHMAMRESWERIELTKKAIAAAEENYQMNKKQYQLQLASNQAVLNAQDRLARADANYIQAMADYRLSLAKLYAAMGMRNDALDPLYSQQSAVDSLQLAD